MDDENVAKLLPSLSVNFLNNTKEAQDVLKLEGKKRLDLSRTMSSQNTETTALPRVVVPQGSTSEHV
jgi:hypothetical protein